MLFFQIHEFIVTTYAIVAAPAPSYPTVSWDPHAGVRTR